MKKDTRLSLIALTKLHVIVFTFVGLLAGILYSFGGLVYDAAMGSLGYGTVLAFGALIGMPMIGAIVGIVARIVEWLLFRIASGLLGGIEINFKE